MDERNRTDAGAPPHASVEVKGGGDDESSMLAAEPLRRLESELEWINCGRPDGAQGYAQTRRLLEEAWSLFTECLVLRDGLLEASKEIESTMDGLQRQLGALPVAVEPNGHERANPREHLVNGNRTSASNSNGASPH